MGKHYPKQLLTVDQISVLFNSNPNLAHTRTMEMVYEENGTGMN